MTSFKLILFLFILSATFAKGTTSSAYWLSQSSPTNKDLWHVSFLDSLNGWIAGDSGLIMRTTNGGVNWIVQNSGIDKMIRKLFVINERQLRAIAWEINPEPPAYYGTIFLTSTNGGETWTHEMYSDSNVFINTTYYLDSLYGFIAGYPSVLRYTTNGGIEWINSSIDSSFVSGFPIFSIAFYDDLVGHACGGVIDIAGAVFSTYDGGRSWTSLVVGPEPVNDLYIFDSLNVIGAGGDFEYGASTITTSNAGKSWDYRKLQVFGIPNAIDFRTPAEGWIAMGIAEVFLYTLDSAKTWDTIGTPGSIVIHDVDFVDERHGWAVGDGGKIFKYNYSKVSIGIIAEDFKKDFRLYQNYPNPFNPFTVIYYSVPENAVVELKVFNITGKEIRTLVYDFHYAGSYKVDFNGSGLPSGVYFVQMNGSLKNGNKKFSDTKKMLLIK